MTQNYVKISNEIVVTMNVNGILLGADESLTKLKEIDGYLFKKIKLSEFKYKDHILQANQKLNYRYYQSQIQTNINNIDESSFVGFCKENELIIESPIKWGNGPMIFTNQTYNIPELDAIEEEEFQKINRIVSKLMILRTADIALADIFIDFSFVFLMGNVNKSNKSIIDDSKTIIKNKYKIGLMK